MADDDKALFDSAISDTPEPQPEVTVEQPVEQPGPPRDEHGRFAPKSEAKAEAPQAEAPRAVVEQQPTPEPQRQEPETQGIPSWRLKEEADARRAESEARRAAEKERDELRQYLAQMQRQNTPPAQAPDIFENPSGFVGHEVKSAIDPIKSEILNLREFYSRREAERQYGAEKVQAAYDALFAARRANDPEAIGVVNRVANSMDPFGDIVGWHQKQVVFSQIGSDPNAWFEKQLEERLKDPSHQAKLMERIRGQVQSSQRPVTQLPPSLNKATSSNPQDEDDDNSEAGLLKSALRR